MRHGDGVRITVRLRRPSEHAFFYATGQTERGGTPVVLGGRGSGTDGHQRFSITLRHAQGVRFVTLGVLPWNRRYGTTREVRVG